MKQIKPTVQHFLVILWFHFFPSYRMYAIFNVINKWASYRASWETEREEFGVSLEITSLCKFWSSKHFWAVKDVNQLVSSPTFSPSTSAELLSTLHHLWYIFNPRQSILSVLFPWLNYTVIFSVYLRYRKRRSNMFWYPKRYFTAALILNSSTNCHHIFIENEILRQCGGLFKMNHWKVSSEEEISL